MSRIAAGGVTRAETVAEALREAILVGRFLSGERLIEIKLAQVYDVSQNTVRDALRILEQEGWVVKTPRLGVHVRAISATDAAEVCALISEVEALALAWAMEPNNHKALRADLAPLVAAARKFAYGNDRFQAFDQLLHFHQQIGAAAGKPLTAQVLDTLYNQIRLLEALRRARAPRSPAELDSILDAHDTLLRLIDTGDADAACQFLREQIADYNAAIAGALRL